MVSGICEGRVVVVTGAGRGIGREHALEFARQGARVVVNDLGVARDGSQIGSAPANEVVADHELFDTALAWARKLAGQAPVAVEQIKTVSAKADLDDGIEAEKGGFAAAFGSEDAREGIGAFLGKRKPRWQGK